MRVRPALRSPTPASWLCSGQAVSDATLSVHTNTHEAHVSMCTMMLKHASTHQSESALSSSFYKASKSQDLDVQISNPTSVNSASIPQLGDLICLPLPSPAASRSQVSHLPPPSQISHLMKQS